MAKEIIFEDSFENGLDVGTIEDGRKWNYMQMGPVKIGTEGFQTEISDGLHVTPEGRNKDTDEPMFTTTAPGQGDHMKWSINANLAASDGVHGIEIPEGKTINVEAEIGGRQYGTADHPFGDAVPDSDDELRFGIPLLMAFDPEHMVVFDFALTNKRIYAIYERGKMMGSDAEKPAAYSYEIPLADRTPDEVHKLRFSYSPASNTVSWYIDDELKSQIKGNGRRIERTHMYVDNGGKDDEVTVRVFNCGLGILSLLDGAKNGGKGLVNLTGGNDYFDPQKGEPHQAEFVFDEATDENKLFGQGAELICKAFRVYFT